MIHCLHQYLGFPMGKSFTVRPTQPSDLAEIDALLGRAYPVLLKPHYLPSVFVTAMPHITKAQPRLLASGTYFGVVDESGQIIGAGGWTANAPGMPAERSSKVGHIRHVVTDPDVVRQGIGRLLMDHIFQSAKSAGIVRLDCLSTLMAVPFYAACGFEMVEKTTVNLRPGIDFPAVFMHRDL